jgi:hypothetical protein
MGFWSRLFSREDTETRRARERMAVDAQDPRKLFVWGIVAVSYEVDPAYLAEHANTAVREWYGVKTGQDIISWTPSDFSTRDHVAYNQYRLCFLARAGFGAGLLDEQTSWQLAFRHAAVAQQHYPDWQAYGQGYLEGHLQYRHHQKDSDADLTRYRKSIGERLLLKQRTVWHAIPWNTRLW